MKTLTEQDYLEFSKYLNCEVALIKAVSDVESGRYGGFLPNGEPVILFEPYIFSRQTNQKYDGKTCIINNHIYSLSIPGLWNKIKADYGPIDIQHSKLNEACKLDRNAALMSCSWGKYQLMGFNYKVCGFSTIQDFVNAMYKDEKSHLWAFCNFLHDTYIKRGLFERKYSLAELLSGKDFKTFTKGYNGEGQIDVYSQKLINAYNKYK